jgi:aspartate/methionine/tyrosine aminotransferase
LVSPPIVPLARRMDHIAPFHVMELLAKGRAHEARGRSIVHMEIGEPDFPAAEPIVRATAQALQEGRTHYTPAVGLPVLREAIAQWYAERCAVEVDPQRVVVTPGASGALQLIFGVLVDPADRVLMTDPGYPCNRHFVRLFEGKPVGIPVDATSGYQLTPELVEQTWTPQTRAVLVGSPANPTGTLIAPDALERIYQWVTERGGRLIVDEIYHGLVYGHTVRSALAGRSDLFVVNSFSKYFGMTGWRVGWIVAPLGYVREARPEHLHLACDAFSARGTSGSAAGYRGRAGASPPALSGTPRLSGAGSARARPSRRRRAPGCFLRLRQLLFPLGQQLSARRGSPGAGGCGSHARDRLWRSPRPSAPALRLHDLAAEPPGGRRENPQVP